ncbi:MAG: hypothetical protein QOJ20_698 [Mycobacterium sp.]|jgi:hypothetical protein|nr:hypothetical protein [Mycobacterium sp.]
MLTKLIHALRGLLERRRHESSESMAMRGVHLETALSQIP